MDVKQKPMTFLFENDVMNFNKANDFFTEICDTIRDFSSVDAVECAAIFQTLNMISARLVLENPSLLTIENIIKMLKNEIRNEENKENNLMICVIATENLSSHDLFYQRFSQKMDVRKHLPYNAATLFLKAWKLYTREKFPDSQ